MDALAWCSPPVTAACWACTGNPNPELQAASLRPAQPVLNVTFDLSHIQAQNRPSSEISCLRAIAGRSARAWQVGNFSFQSTVGRYKEKSGKEALTGLFANADTILISKCVPRDVHSWECSSKAGRDSCEDPCFSSRLKSCLRWHTAC